MQIVIRTLNDNLYNTVAATPAAIRTELENATSFLVSDLKNRYQVLILRHAIAEFIQQSAADYLRRLEEP